MKKLAAIAAAAVATTVLAACSAVPVTLTATTVPGHLRVGAVDSSYQAFKSSTGVSPSIMEHYIAPFTALPLQFAGPAEPLVQIEPRHASLKAVTAGKYDAWLRKLAAQAKAYGRPLMIGWAPEMNGPWYSWGYKSVTPAQYVAAWRHVVTLFRQAGAVNVQWIWTVNVTTPRVSSPAAWWPGTRWVNLVGIDGYVLAASQTYANLIAPTVARVRRFWAGPVILSETGVSPRTNQAAKIRNLFAGARADHLAALVWFDLKGNEDWRLTRASALSAFRAEAKASG